MREASLGVVSKLFRMEKPTSLEGAKFHCADQYVWVMNGANGQAIAIDMDKS